MEGVEVARARVRELTPLIFTFDLPMIMCGQHHMRAPSTDADEQPYLRAVQDQYGVQVSSSKVVAKLYFIFLSYYWINRFLSLMCR